MNSLNIARYLIIIFGILFFLVSNSFAAPNITDVIVDENKIIISGIEFGSHIDYNPADQSIINTAWTDFEDNHLQGSDFMWFMAAAMKGNWRMRSDNARTNSGFYSEHWYDPQIKIDYPGEDTRTGAYGVRASIPSTKIYETFWFKLRENNQSGKFLRIFGDGFGGTGSQYIYLSTGGNNTMIRARGCITVNSNQICESEQLTSPNSFGYETWHRVEVMIDIVAQTLKVYMNGILQYQKGSTYIPSNFEVVGSNWDYGHMVDNSIGFNVDGGYDYDDIYFDQTFARVELGNAPVWSECTVREIQPLASWDDNGTSIQTKFNQGAFLQGSTAYVYVVDDNGSVSNGVPIVISQTIPSITNTTSFNNNGSTVIISGSSFGVKNPAMPLLFDSFDDGVEGEDVSDSSNWNQYSSASPKYSNDVPYGGSGFSAYNFVDENSSSDFYTVYSTFEASDELYYSYMNRYSGTGVDGQVYKNGRINTDAGSSAYSTNGMIAISDNYLFYSHDSSSVYPDGRHFVIADLDSNSWQRHQIYGRVSSPSGEANGEIWVQVGKEGKSYKNVVTRSAGYSFKYNKIILGLMVTNIDPNNYHYLYVDDVYVDNTLARIELCDSAVFGPSAKCSIQLPVIWSDSSITFTVNQGDLKNTENLYLFVVNEDGEVNGTGFHIMIGNNELEIRNDVNQDSQINTTDAMLTLRNSLNLDMSGTAWQDSVTTGDVNCDNISNSIDAMLLLRYSLGLSMDETGWCE